MSGDNLKHVSPGEKLIIPAPTWNDFIGAAKYVKGKQRGISSRHPYDDSRNELLYVRNDTGADLPRFSVLGLGDVIITPAGNLDEFKNVALFKGLKPNAALHRGKFCVLAEPAPKDQIRSAFIYGVVPVLVNVAVSEDEEPDPASVKFADVPPTDETRFLQADSSGSAQILWMDPEPATLDSGGGPLG